jgi:hypothetical protein
MRAGKGQVARLALRVSLARLSTEVEGCIRYAESAGLSELSPCPGSLRTNLRFEVLLQMMAREVKRAVVLLQTTDHDASFQRAYNQHGQFGGINVRADFGPSFPLLSNLFETIQPGTKGLPSFRSQPRIAIIGIDSRVQQRASSWYHTGAPGTKIPDDLLQPIHGIGNLVRPFEARIHCELPGVLEGFSGKVLLAVKVPVNSTFLQPRRSHEVRQGCAVIPFLIENGSRLANYFLPRLLAFAHVGTPKEAIQRPYGHLFYEPDLWMRPNGLWLHQRRPRTPIKL